MHHCTLINVLCGLNKAESYKIM